MNFWLNLDDKNNENNENKNIKKNIANYYVDDPNKMLKELEIAFREKNDSQFHTILNKLNTSLKKETLNNKKLSSTITSLDLTIKDIPGVPRKGAKLRHLKKCSSCSKKFGTTFGRGHNCRSCGYMFCRKCSSNKQILPHRFGYGDIPMRACDDCVKWFQTALDDVFDNKAENSNLSNGNMSMERITKNNNDNLKMTTNDIDSDKKQIDNHPSHNSIILDSPASWLLHQVSISHKNGELSIPQRQKVKQLIVNGQYEIASQTLNKLISTPSSKKSDATFSDKDGDEEDEDDEDEDEDNPQLNRKERMQSRTMSLDAVEWRDRSSRPKSNSILESQLMLVNSRMETIGDETLEHEYQSDDEGYHSRVRAHSSSSSPQLTPTIIENFDEEDDNDNEDEEDEDEDDSCKYYSDCDQYKESYIRLANPEDTYVKKNSQKNEIDDDVEDKEEKKEEENEEDLEETEEDKSKSNVFLHSRTRRLRSQSGETVVKPPIPKEKTLRSRKPRSVSVDAAQFVNGQIEGSQMHVSGSYDVIQEEYDETSLSMPYDKINTSQTTSFVLHFAVSRISSKDSIRRTLGFAKKSLVQDRFTLEVYRLQGIVQAKGVFRHRFWSFRCDAVEELRDSNIGSECLEIVVAMGQGNEVFAFRFANTVQKQAFCNAVNEWNYCSPSTNSSTMVSPAESYSKNGNIKTPEPTYTVDSSAINLLRQVSSIEAGNSNSPIVIDLLPGEKEVNGTAWPATMILGHINSDDEVWGRVRGVISITNYRLIFIPFDPGYVSKSRSLIYIPLFAVVSVQRESINRQTKTDKFGNAGGMVITCKDFRSMSIELDGYMSITEERTQALTLLITALSESVQRIGKGSDQGHASFARCYSLKVSPQNDGWKLYDIEREFLRQMIKLDASDTGPPKLKLYSNQHGELCRSYPSKVLLPFSFTTPKLYSVSAFRAKGRLPVVTWYHKNNGCVLVRSGQPLLGNILTGSASRADQELVDFYRRLPNYQATISGNENNNVDDTRPIYIFDARKVKASTGNRIMGKGGVETSQDYPGAIIHHLNIGNIYRMQWSYQALMKLLLPGGSEDKTWWSSIESSRWLEHIRLIIRGALKIARVLEMEKASVLVHCSDGWDRTSQLVSLAQLMLDPYYRTIQGFAVLIEKDWCDFGHKFAERLGGDRDKDPDGAKCSPIFLQFIDSVWQIQSQFPSAFEYNENFLLHIANSLTSGLYGTFLHDFRLQREAFGVSKFTVSVWTPVLSDLGRYTNDRYVESKSPIWPWSGQPMIRLWESYYFQWHPKYPRNRWISFKTYGQNIPNQDDRRKRVGSSHTIAIGAVPIPPPTIDAVKKMFR